MSSIVTERDLRRAFGRLHARVEKVELVAPGSVRVIVTLLPRNWKPTEPAARLAQLRAVLNEYGPLGTAFEIVQSSGDGPYR